jgi:hypothetical protein
MKKLILIFLFPGYLIFPGNGWAHQPPLKIVRSQRIEARKDIDVLVISIKGAFGENRRPDYYFELQSNGKLLMLKGDSEQNMLEVRAGKLPLRLVRRVFRVAKMPSVLYARDTDPGEIMFSDSDWVNVGIVTKGRVKNYIGWAYTEEIKDYPAEFQSLLQELKAKGEMMLKASYIKALVWARAVDSQRVRAIEEDRKVNIRFHLVSQESLKNIHALKQAFYTPGRIFPIKDDAELKKFMELSRAAHPKSEGGGGIFKTQEGKHYEVWMYASRP